MEFEYRKLSEEKANEIDAYGFTDWQGKKIRINKLYSVTNKDETIVFRQTFFSHEEDIPDRYFLIFKDRYYFINIFVRDIKKVIVNNNNCLKYILEVDEVYDVFNRQKVYQITEIVKILKTVLYIRYFCGNQTKTQGTEVFIEVSYKGEQI